MNGDSGDLESLTIFHVCEQLMLRSVSRKLGADGGAGAQQSAVLNEKTEAADGGGHAVKEGERLSGERIFGKHLQDREYIFVGDRDFVFPGPELHSTAFDEASPVSRGAVEGFTHCAAMEAVEEVEWHRKVAFET